MSLRRILVAVDGGSIAGYAVEVAAELAYSLDSEVGLVHAVGPAEAAAGPMHTSQTTAEECGKQLLAEICERLSPIGVVHQFLHVGDPATEITKAAAAWSADLIVIGSQTRKGTKRVVQGSVAEAVMRDARCPVLVVRGRP